MVYSQRCFFILFLTLFVSGCVTPERRNTEFEAAPLFGMLYDYQGQPCSAAIIIIDNEIEVQTDINGRFVIQNLSNGRHTLYMVKEGYERLSVDFTFADRNQVLYLNAVSFEQLLEQIEQALEEKNYSQAQSHLQRADSIKRNHPISMYLKAIYFVGLEQYPQAISTLMQLLNNNQPDPSIHLFLADIYEYYLQDPANAIVNLEEYLKALEDAEIEQRLISLKSQLDQSGNEEK